MRRYFHGSALFLCILALCVSGCGGSGGSAADPMGTATVQFIDEAGKVLVPTTTGGPFAFTVYPGESRQLIVWVTNARVDKDGKTTIVPVVNEYVSFTLLTPANGGSIRMVKERTDSSGRAIAMYTAGNNYAMDEVRATTEAGASAQLTILKTGGLVGTQISSLTASSTTVVDGQTSVITANVTDGNNNPKQGEAVTFTLATNDSNACFINSSRACVARVVVYSNVSGNAEATYHAGSQWPDSTVYDTVRATISNGSTKSIVMTRSSATDLSISVAASPTSVAAGDASIITATVTGDNNSGVTVYFSIPSASNNSGATLSASSAKTDGSGKASVTYTAGSNYPTVNVDDVVKVEVGSVSASAIITRTGTGVISYSIALTANPSSFPLFTTGDTVSSVLTAEVTSDYAISGLTVTFSIMSGGGTLSSATAITDASGKAVVSYTRIMTEAAGTTVSVVLKATLPDGATAMETIQIYL